MQFTNKMTDTTTHPSLMGCSVLGTRTSSRVYRDKTKADKMVNKHAQGFTIHTSNLH